MGGTGAYKGNNILHIHFKEFMSFVFPCQFWVGMKNAHLKPAGTLSFKCKAFRFEKKELK